MTDTSVEANLGLVHMIARRYVGTTGGALEFQDLVQVGAMGLERARDTYDPERGAFATYAAWWIREAIHGEIARSAKVVYLPRRVYQRRRHAGALPSSLRLDDSSTPRTLRAPTAEIESELDQDRARRALDALKPRERRVIEATFWDELGTNAIARELGVTKQRIQQIRAKAMAKLRAVVAPEVHNVHV